MRPRLLPSLGAAVALLGGTLASGPPASAAVGCAPSTRTVTRPLLPRGTGEVSGLVASQRYPGWGWMIRDSGNPASLFAIKLDDPGSPPLVREIKVAGIWNTDFEDVVLRWGDPDRLYIIESGQSGRDHFIHEVAEPDPQGPATITPIARYDYAYPNGAKFNTESAFWYAGRLVFVTKTAPGFVYRFTDPLTTGKVNVPAYVGRLEFADDVSVVRVSWDWKTIIASDHERTRTYQAPGVTKDLAKLIARQPVSCEHMAPGDNVEGGDFVPPGTRNIRLIAESGHVYGLPDPNPTVP